MSIRKRDAVVLRLTVIGLLLSTIAIAPLWAGSGDEGSAAGVFLKVDPGARSSAMGSAYVAAPVDPYAVQFNPAVYADVNNRNGSLTRTDIFEGVTYNNLSYMTSLGREGEAYGVNVKHLDYGSQDRTKIDPNSSDGLEPVTGEGDFSSGDISVGIGGGKRLTPELTVGLRGKYVRENIEGYTDETYSFDLGGRYRLVENHLWLGAAARNVIGELSLNKKEDSLPAEYDVGVYYTRPFPENNLRFSGGFDYVFSDDADGYFALGGELGIRDTFYLRLGYKGAQEADNGFTLGGGLSYERFKVDFSMVEFGELGRQQKLSLIYEFGN